MKKSIDDFTDTQREKEAKILFKIAVDYLKLKSAEIEKSRELFAEYLKWNKYEWDVNTMVYEKIGDAYKKYSKNNNNYKSEAEANYKKVFNYFFKNKDKTDLLAETYRYRLAECYLKGIGTDVSKEKSYEMFESWYEYISVKSLEYNRKLRGPAAYKIYTYLALFNDCDENSLSTIINNGKATDYKVLKIWLTRILEIVPTYREVTRDIKLVDHYLNKPKLLEARKRRTKESDENNIIFNKIKNHVTKNPPDFDKAYQIFFEHNSGELSSKILNLENLGKIYLRIAEKKNTILITESERLHKTAFELCRKGGRYDFGSSYTLARFYFEGIGTQQSFIKGQDTLLISYHGMLENTDKEKELKASRAHHISNTFQKKDAAGPNRIYEEAKEDLKTAKIWLLKSKTLGGVYKIDEKIEELEKKISSQKPNQHFQKNFESKEKESPPIPIESYDGQDLAYLHGILMKYFNNNAGFFGGYKPAKYSDLASYLTAMHIQELRVGNKAAAKVGMIRPMSIPEAVLSMKPFLVEQVGGWDPLGSNIFITIKK